MPFVKNFRYPGPLTIVLRLILGAVFLVSGCMKLGHLEQFYEMAQAYKILSPGMTQLYAAWLPWLEILAGAGLILGLFIRFSAALTALLLLSFLIALGQALLRGEAIDCGCFLGGAKPEPVSWNLWFRDVLMFLGAGLLLVVKDHPWSLDALMQTRPAVTAWRKPLAALLVLFGLATGYMALTSKIPEKPKPVPPTVEPALLETGVPAPDFTLSDLDGKSYTLSRFRHRKAVLVEFFATWCPHCQHSVPLLKQLQSNYGSRVQVLSINAGDPPGEPSTAPAFRKHFQLNYPVLEHASPALYEAYHLYAFPTLYLVSPDGVIVWSHKGTLGPEAYDALRAVLEGHGKTSGKP